MQRLQNGQRPLSLHLGQSQRQLLNFAIFWSESVGEGGRGGERGGKWELSEFWEGDVGIGVEFVESGLHDEEINLKLGENSAENRVSAVEGGDRDKLMISIIGQPANIKLD